MRTRSRLPIGGLSAALLIALTVGAASASRLSLSSQGFRVVWTSFQIGTEELTYVNCPVTLEGSFHSATMRKIAGLALGKVTNAGFAGGSCSRGGVIASFTTETLPWTVTYESFLGTLPNIRAIELRIQRFTKLIEISGLLCTYGAEARGSRVRALVSGGTITSLELEPFTPLVLVSGLMLFCPEGMMERGSGRYTQSGGTQTVTVRLI